MDSDKSCPERARDMEFTSLDWPSLCGRGVYVYAWRAGRLSSVIALSMDFKGARAG